MRKIIGIGETVLDIIHRQNQQGEWVPTKSVPGGSTFNSIITLARLGVNTTLMTELTNDRVGKGIMSFMEKNGTSTGSIDIYSEKDSRTPISLAYMDENNNAEYVFYSLYPEERFNVVIPRIDEGDIVILGSFFAINPILREQVCNLLEYAKTRKAIIYYDINYRKNHAAKVMYLMPNIIENLEYADIVRGSDEDLEIVYKLTDIERIYNDKIKFYCPNFICTKGGRGVDFYCPEGYKHFDSKYIENPVSTIGAGDTFNAGILFGLLRCNVTLDNLYTLTRERWGEIIEYALEFSAQVCMSDENYLPLEVAQKYR